MQSQNSNTHPNTTPIITKQKNIACNGEKQNNADSGHPKIYLNMGQNNKIACPYCGQLFQYQKTK